MNSTLERIRTLATAANTYLVAGALIVSIVTQEVAEELDGDTAEVVVRIGGKVVAWLGAAIMIVRRSTTVIEQQRGLLPIAGPIIPDANDE